LSPIPGRGGAVGVNASPDADDASFLLTPGLSDATNWTLVSQSKQSQFAGAVLSVNDTTTNPCSDGPDVVLAAPGASGTSAQTWVVGSAPHPPGTMPIAFKRMGGVVPDASAGSWVFPEKEGLTVVFNNSIFTQAGWVLECGLNLSDWQAQDPSHDPGTTVGPFPPDDDLIAASRIVLGLATTSSTAAAAAVDAAAPPPASAPPRPQLYTKLGAIEVGTYENTLFYYDGRIYNVENIACSFPEHAGVWQPEVFGNHSYARIRDFATGAIVANVTNSVGFGFVSAFVDYDLGASTGTVWLFGTPADRCGGNGAPTTVQSWRSRDLVHWQTAMAFDYGHTTHNVQVTRVAALGGAPPAEREAWAAAAAASPAAAVAPPGAYVMFLECFAWAINLNADGDLSHGWTLLANTSAPPGAPCGGPSFTYSPLDGYFYHLTGGNVVWLVRSQDFRSWQVSDPSPFLAPSAGDALIAPFQNFAAVAARKGSPPAAHVGVPEPDPFVPFQPVWMSNWTSWSMNSNDADFCCMHADVASAHLIWGASTQGRRPLPPLDGSDASTNSVATAAMPLTELLAAYFSAPSSRREA
jgi:hypothetical protein